MADIQARKADHIQIAAHGDVGFLNQSTLLECVQLCHNSLPELAVDEIDLSCEVLGRSLRAPLLIAAMTGGTEQAGQLNRALARVAAAGGYALGLGSQRPMLTRPETAPSYLLRTEAPDALILGNLGAAQVRELPTQAVSELLERVGADALCVHLNPAQELIQPHGDRDFRGCAAAIERLVRELDRPVVAKETGAGMSAALIRRLAALGVKHVDVSGAGGTSWVAVEAERAEGAQQLLGQLLRDWGIPTAASVIAARDGRMSTVFATGGIKNGLDVARAVALGATAAGIARPVLQALLARGEEGALTFLRQVELELRTVMVLVGAKDLEALRAAPRWLSEPLARWQAAWEATP